jgi:hypothetical protein
MKLPPGATGFDPPPADQGGDLRAFTAVCHNAARRTSGIVTAVTPAAVTPNFHTILIAYGPRQVAVLRHGVLPLAAFAQPPRDGEMTVTFIDDPGLAEAIAEISALQILTVEELHTPLTRVDLTALSSGEHDQIRYWKPHTAGELLFNYWD